jgi:hypothetical protein
MALRKKGNIMTQPLSRALSGDEVLFLKLWLGGMPANLIELGLMTYDDEGLSLTSMGAMATVLSRDMPGIDDTIEALANETMPVAAFNELNTYFEAMAKIRKKR